MAAKLPVSIAHYKIISSIGAGGMGEVYLAQDSKLERQVALKVLLEEVAGDEDRVKRFVQEAKAASALNHPNILTVYEIGEFEHTRYIATELIKGETLRDRLGREPMTLREILDVAMQVAAALNAAHNAGIVHRDIKPENIMLRDDGIVKVLDFGLAKLVATASGSVESEDATRAQVNTRPGVVMGTVHYMSPEQARGKETDVRCDVWSLGVVMYEMLTKKTPFAGETANDSIAAILTKEPPPLDEATPSELRRIVRKSLQKQTDERYQTVKDLLLDVKNIKRELEFSEELERSHVPQSTGSSNVGTAQLSENASAMLSGFGESTVSGQNAATQNVTTSSSSLEYAVTQAKSHKLATAVAAVLLVAVISAVGYFGFLSKGSAGQISSIAVMPFVNESGNSDIEYLSDGMTETLISSLSNIPNLSVKARSTVFYYKGKETSAKKIGEELKVQAVLFGRVSQRGDDLKLSLELVNTETQDVIWSEQYNRKQSDLVSLQSEIAKTVSNKLRLKLTATEQERVSKTNTTSSEAQQLYLKGRFHWNKRNIADFQKAREYFQQAIAADPNYALAYTGLADTLALMPYYGNFRPNEYMPLAKQAAQKALEIDPDLAEAHASLGQILTNYDYDFKGAERELKRAIEHDPKYPTAYQWLSENYMYVGNNDQALSEVNKALELDPLAMVINNNKGRVFVSEGKLEEAIAQFKKTAELYPDFISPHNNLGDIYESKGMYSEAIEQRLIQAKITGVSPENIKSLQFAFEKGGYKGFVQKQIDIQLDSQRSSLEKDKNAYLPAFRIAIDYARLQDKDKTFEYLNKAYDQREPQIAELKIRLPFIFLRDDPRFKELLKKVGFPE